MITLEELRAELAPIIAAINVLQQDVRSIRTDVSALTRTIDVMQHDVRMLRSSAEDASDLRVTAGEVTVLHSDLNRLERRVAALEANRDDR